MFFCRILDVGGLERHWASLLPALQSAGLPCHLVTVKGDGRALKSVQDAGVEVTVLEQKGIPAFRELPLLTIRRLLSLLTQKRPSVIVSGSYGDILVAAMYSRLTRTPHVINWHRQPGFRGTANHERAVSFAGAFGAGAISVSESQRDDLRGFRIPDTRIAIVSNGVNGPSGPYPPKDNLRKELGLPKGRRLVTLLARLRPEKCVSNFLRAISDLDARGLPISGLVVGDGPMEQELRSEASSLRAPVTFVGYQKDPYPYLIASDMACLTSDFEALPMSLLEAASCGIPCVATDVGGTREIIDDQVTGLIVPPGDIPALSLAIERLALDDEGRRSMGERSRLRWQDLFSFEHMVTEYLRLLTSVSGPPTTWENKQ